MQLSELRQCGVNRISQASKWHQEIQTVLSIEFDVVTIEPLHPTKQPTFITV